MRPSLAAATLVVAVPAAAGGYLAAVAGRLHASAKVLWGEWSGSTVARPPGRPAAGESGSRGVGEMSADRLIGDSACGLSTHGTPVGIMAAGERVRSSTTAGTRPGDRAGHVRTADQ